MKLLYIYDALCGWCYGFSPVIEQFVKDKGLECEVISGGMITGDRVGPIGEVAAYISTAYKDVEQRSGVKFGKDFLDGTLADGSAIFTSLPAAIAMTIFREYKPEQQLSFASDIQKAIYYHGKKPLETQTYVELAEVVGIDAKEFEQKMTDDKYLEKAKQDFAISSQLQVTGFPTVFLLQENSAAPIARGYITLEQLENHYQQALQAFENAG
ncbi:DsbA family protein [Nonlabens ponticola]|uniref:DsbA family protein n=1 Tax=Nonlabens ponticola TaxID=2496866 RepID=A0A3S9N0G9_9FLAO|nr:DsbA family protein [Nonlabens ponticola]AZQ44874.1 DsbA family protein [Nonlabens ponticola]